MSRIPLYAQHPHGVILFRDRFDQPQTATTQTRNTPTAGKKKNSQNKGQGTKGAPEIPASTNTSRPADPHTCTNPLTYKPTPQQKDKHMHKFSTPTKPFPTLKQTPNSQTHTTRRTHTPARHRGLQKLFLYPHPLEVARDDPYPAVVDVLCS